MTFNIRNGQADDGVNSWENRKELTAKVIRESDCDIIGLQEVFQFQLEYLQSVLPEYSVYSIGREDGESEGEQCSILWREGALHLVDMGTFWLSDTPDIPNSMAWGNRITRICSWIAFDEGFYFYNTHWDHESSQARRKSAELIASKHLGEYPWILVGDFNAVSTSPDIGPLLAVKGCQFISNDNAIGTFHNFLGGEGGESIDHMFVGGGITAKLLEVVQYSEKDIFPSDHYPVIFEVQMNSNRPSP